MRRAPDEGPMHSLAIAAKTVPALSFRKTVRRSLREWAQHCELS
jgi:hypothetical protein